MLTSPATACARLLAALMLLAACAAPNSTASPPPAGEITVAAASDLQFAFTNLAGLFEQQTGQRVTLVLGSTGQLAQQIEHGAPYDLFAAANISFVQDLADKGLVIPESITLYAQGRIVLAVNRQAGVRATHLEDLLSSDIRHIAIANPEHAPYGAAAKQSLESLDLWLPLQDKIVLGENVRQALQYVQSGDAEVGIIALSVANVPEISWTLIDDALHLPLNQAIAMLTSSARPEQALAFVDFINSETGRPIMRQYGFILPGETPLDLATPAP